MSEETEFAIILQALPGIGAAGLGHLLAQFGSFEQTLRVAESQLPNRYRKALRQYHANPEHHHCLARQTIESCASDGISIVIFDDPLYPPLLREIDSPPSILYVRGNINLLSLPQIAIVGSRQHSASGEANAGAFAKNLCASGFVITSGMALGIDAAAHSGAMAAGETIAVLGTGIDVIYPRQHRNLYQKILTSGGTIVTEFPRALQLELEIFHSETVLLAASASVYWL